MTLILGYTLSSVNELEEWFWLFWGIWVRRTKFCVILVLQLALILCNCECKWIKFVCISYFYFLHYKCYYLVIEEWWRESKHFSTKILFQFRWSNIWSVLHLLGVSASAVTITKSIIFVAVLQVGSMQVFKALKGEVFTFYIYDLAYFLLHSLCSTICYPYHMKDDCYMLV